MIIQEGEAKIRAYEGKISKKLPVFYNPLMKLNRDISILLLKSIENTGMQVADPLAGSGIRAIRFLKELPKDKIFSLELNDLNAKDLKQNLEDNSVDRYVISNMDANEFLLQSKGFDYIDIDPFGSPNPFLQSAVSRISRGGILAVTATDTSALAGSSQTACLRKYWARPMRNEMMHEIGIRILIRKVQLIGMDNEKALTPIFSYFKDHYYRIFFRCEKGRKKADEIGKMHRYFLYNKETLDMEVSEFNRKEGFEYAGPLWCGNLWNHGLAEKMYEIADKADKKLIDMLSFIKDESMIDSVGFYDLNRLAKIRKTKIPRIDGIVSKGKIERTHFLGWGVKSKEKPF